MEELILARDFIFKMMEIYWFVLIVPPIVGTYFNLKEKKA